MIRHETSDAYAVQCICPYIAPTRGTGERYLHALPPGSINSGTPRPAASKFAMEIRLQLTQDKGLIASHSPPDFIFKDDFTLSGNHN